jgi:hypothetical protein
MIRRSRWTYTRNSFCSSSIKISRGCS